MKWIGALSLLSTSPLSTLPFCCFCIRALALLELRHFSDSLGLGRLKNREWT